MISRSRSGPRLLRLTAAVALQIVTLAAVRRASAQVPAVAAPTPKGMSALEGTFRDTLGHPIPYGTVTVENTMLSTVANDSGHFHLDSVPAGVTQFTARRIGYAPVTFQIDMPAAYTIHADIRLKSVVRLQTVAVTAEGPSQQLARDGYYQRQLAGWGSYLTPADLDKKPVQFASEFLAGLRGVRLMARRGLPGFSIRFTDFGSGCMWLWVDGGYIGNTANGGPELDDYITNPAEIYAIEVYSQSNEVPQQFTGTMRPSKQGRSTMAPGPQPPDHCGAVVIWTKEHASP